MYLTPLLLADVFILFIIVLVPLAVPQTWQHRPDSSWEYLVSTEEMTCHNARSFCEDRDGYTVTLQDANDKDYVNGLVTDGESFFIGLYKRAFSTIRAWHFGNAPYTPDDANWDGVEPDPIRDYCECTVQSRSDQLWEITNCDTTKYRFVCSRISDRCSTIVCKNGGICRETEEVFGYTCDCPSGYNGSQCQEDINECLDTNLCKNGGHCINTDGSYTCDCSSTGYENKHCTSDVDECLFDPPICRNGGNCSNIPNSYICNCGTTGFEGVNCSSDINECLHDQPVCRNGATCVNIDGSYACECGSTGFQGKHCTSDVNECLKDPPICLNNGTCSNIAGTYSCTCHEDFAGNNCQARINDCETMNGTLLCEPGYCVDGILNYTCVCPDGTSGAQSCPEMLNGDVGSFEDEADDDDSSGGAGNVDESHGGRNCCGFDLISTCVLLACSFLRCSKMF